MLYPLLAIITFTALTHASSTAWAHPLEPPRVLHEETAEWPAGHALPHDLVIPVSFVIGTDGAIEDVSVEAGVGEPFDSAAAAAAKKWRFAPAVDASVKESKGAVRAKIRAVVRFVGVARAQKIVPPASAPSSEPAPPSERAPLGESAPTGVEPRGASGRPDLPEASTEFIVRGEAAARSASETRRDQRIFGAAPHQTASDLLTTVPGVFVTQHSGQGKAHQIFFRGFDAVHGQDIEFWVAGAPVNEVSNVHGQGYADLHFVMPEVVRSIRAQPGAYDPRQGDFAVAGSMEFELGYDQPGVTAKASIGSFGTRRGFLAYHPEGASDRTFAAAELEKTDGFGQARAANRASGIGQLEVQLGPGVALTLMASAYAARFGSAGVLRLDDIEAGAIDRFGTYDSDQGGRSERTQLVATVRASREEYELELAPFFVRRSLTLRSNYTGYLEDPVHGDSNQQVNEADTLGLRASFRRRLRLLSRYDALEAGVVLRSDFIEQSQRRLSGVDDSVTRTDVDARVRATDIGAYLDAELRPIRRVALRGGVRADGLSFSATDRGSTGGAARSAQGTHVGAKGALDVVVAPGVWATASYGQGFRSPQARSLGDGERTPFTEVESGELGVRYQDGRKLSAALALYRTTLSEDLVFDEATARNQRVPATSRTGVVADLVAEPTSFLTSAVGFTYTRATFRDSDGRYGEGELVPFVPQVVARADMTLKASLARVGSRTLEGRIGAGATYLYRRPIPYGEIGSDVALLDVVLGARLRELELTLETWNVLNRDWNDGEFVYASNFRRGAVASQLPVRHVTAGAPRSALLSLTLHL